jgi:GGDEF domain-containing protein
VTPPGESIRDEASGLFSEAFLRAVLPARVAASRRGLHQLGLVLIEIRDGTGAEAAEVLTRTVRDSDLSFRLDDGRYALLLEETPVHGCARTAERVREGIDVAMPGALLWAGVACYPAHAFDADEVRAAAERALATARQGAAGTVEVAPVAD